jgi:hypothetical protein
MGVKEDKGFLSAEQEQNHTKEYDSFTARQDRGVIEPDCAPQVTELPTSV